MSKPIDKESFWRERIEDAEKNNRLHFSVYHTNLSAWKTILNNHLNIISQLIDDDDKILDAGCGYGRMSEYFSNYIGIDFSNDFIKKANELYPNKQFIQANLKNTGFNKGQFDWAICVSIKAMVIGNLGEQEWNKIEKELKRVARRILILEYEESARHEIV